MTPAIRDKVIRNTIYSIAGRVWTILVGLVLVPYVISKIGIERFGIWALLSVLVGYFSLLDFGLGVSYIRFISAAYSKGRYDEINQIVNSAFLFNLAAVLPIGVLAVALRMWIFGLLNISVAAYPDATAAYFGTILIFTLTATVGGFSSVLQGIQRMDLSNRIAVAITLPNILATVLFLELGFHLDGLVWASIISSCFGIVLSLKFAWTCVPQLKFDLRLFSWIRVKELLRFGTKMQYARFADLFLFQTDKAIVSYISGLGPVSYYQLGSQLTWRLRELPLLLLSSLLPAASEVYALHDNKKLLDIYIRGTKYLAATTVPLLFFLFASAPVIMAAWLGPGYAMAATISQVLTAGYLFNMLVGVGCIVAAGMDKPDFQLYSSILTTVLNLALAVILGHFYGVYGVAVGVTISLIVGSVYFSLKFHTFICQPLPSFMVMTLRLPILVSLSLAAIIWSANTMFHSAVSESGRLPAVTALFAEFCFFVLIYIYAIVKGRFLDQTDKELFTNNYLYLRIRNIFQTRC